MRILWCSVGTGCQLWQIWGFKAALVVGCQVKLKAKGPSKGSSASANEADGNWVVGCLGSRQQAPGNKVNPPVTNLLYNCNNNNTIRGRATVSAKLIFFLYSTLAPLSSAWRCVKWASGGGFHALMGFVVSFLMFYIINFFGAATFLKFLWHVCFQFVLYCEWF